MTSAEPRRRGPAGARAAAPARAHPIPGTDASRALVDRQNREMTHLLRDAAQVREARERVRASEDELLARSESAALLELIKSHTRPKARHYFSNPPIRQSPVSAEAAP